MKGVMASINPDAAFVDISNEVPAHDVLHGAFVLGMAYKYFPRGTVHIGVVDPGVGSARRSVAVSSEKYTFVGPDNGLFTFVYRETECRIHEVSETKYTLGNALTTFDGRDIYAPVASYLSVGVPIEEVGPEIDDPVSLALPEPARGEDGLKGEIIHIDQFGNLISNIEMKGYYEELRCGQVEIAMGQWKFRGPLKSYSEGCSGEPVCLWGSHGFLEVAVNRGRAADLLPHVERGSELLVHCCQQPGQIEK
jgi:S-adenosylmethionine hydrolase